MEVALENAYLTKSTTDNEFSLNMELNASDIIIQASVVTSSVTVPSVAKEEKLTRKKFNRSNGMPEEWQLAKNLAGWPAYPIDESALERSYTGRFQSNCGFRKIVDRLNNGEQIKLVVYGGSVPFGKACVSSVWGEKCAWPHRVGAWLKYQYPAWNIELINLAQAAFGSEQFLSQPKLDVGDAYILDFCQNDIHVGPQSMLKLIDRLSGPKIMVGSVRTCSNIYVDCYAHCKSRIEDVLESNLQGRTRLPGEGVINITASTFVCSTFWKVQDVLDQTASMRGISLASHRDAIWPIMEEIPSDLAYFWNGMSHPDTVGHDFLAHVVEYALFRELVDIADRNTTACSISSHGEVCANPKTFISSMDTDAATKPLESTGWKLYEDRAGKPGWIATSFPNNRLVFRVAFDRLMEISFLASYQGLFPAFLEIEGCEQPFRLDPIWSNIASMPTSVKFSRTSQDGYKTLECMSSANEMNISITSPQGKFKVLQVLGCRSRIITLDQK